MTIRQAIDVQCDGCGARLGARDAKETDGFRQRSAARQLGWRTRVDRPWAEQDGGFTQRDHDYCPGCAAERDLPYYARQFPSRNPYCPNCDTLLEPHRLARREWRCPDCSVDAGEVVIWQHDQAVWRLPPGDPLPTAALNEHSAGSNPGSATIVAPNQGGC